MEDRIARAMAMDAAGGGSVDAYTRAETDALLDRKVDAVQGKGLSENDYTDAEKAKLAGAAPQATTYTKGEVDAALAEKLDAADVDAALSSASTNPVQNRAVQSPIARLVDAGAKNVADMSETSFTSQTKGGVTVTLSGDTFTSSGTSTSDANNFFNVFYADMSTVLIPPGRWVAVLDGTGVENFRVEEFDSYNATALKGEFGKPFHFEIHAGVTVSYLRITTKPGTLCDGNFRLMICKEEDYAISSEFVPYAPSNRELYGVTSQVDRNTRVVNVATWKTSVTVAIKPIDIIPLQILTIYMGGSHAGIYQYVIFGGNVTQLSNREDEGVITYTIDNDNGTITFSGPSTFMAYLEAKYL